MSVTRATDNYIYISQIQHSTSLGMSPRLVDRVSFVVLLLIECFGRSWGLNRGMQSCTVSDPTDRAIGCCDRDTRVIHVTTINRATSVAIVTT